VLFTVVVLPTALALRSLLDDVGVVGGKVVVLPSAEALRILLKDLGVVGVVGVFLVGASFSKARKGAMGVPLGDASLEDSGEPVTKRSGIAGTGGGVSPSMGLG
jgi:hypothetical protein